MTKKTDNTTIDLDNFLAEIVGTGKKFRLYGQVWTLRPEIPATVMLQLRTSTEQTDIDEVELFKQLLDPPEQYDTLVSLGLGAVAFETVVRVALGVYSGVDPQTVMEQIRNEKTGVQEEEKKDTPTSSNK